MRFRFRCVSRFCFVHIEKCSILDFEERWRPSVLRLLHTIGPEPDHDGSTAMHIRPNDSESTQQLKLATESEGS